MSRSEVEIGRPLVADAPPGAARTPEQQAELDDLVALSQRAPAYFAAVSRFEEAFEQIESMVRLLLGVVSGVSQPVGDVIFREFDTATCFKLLGKIADTTNFDENNKHILNDMIFHFQEINTLRKSISTYGIPTRPKVTNLQILDDRDRTKVPSIINKVLDSPELLDDAYFDLRKTFGLITYFMVVWKNPELSATIDGGLRDHVDSAWRYKTPSRVRVFWATGDRSGG